jgi:hypothetical protein
MNLTVVRVEAVVVVNTAELGVSVEQAAFTVGLAVEAAAEQRAESAVLVQAESCRFAVIRVRNASDH